jgi:hypothetical protein
MEMVLTIKQKGALLEGKSQAIINDHLSQAMYEATMLLEREVKALTPQGVGGAKDGLRATIHGEVEGKGTPAVKGIVGTSSLYGEVIEKGRTPGATWPPAGSLIRWMEVKLGMDEDQAQRLEFVIRRKIGQKGFPAAHMFEKALSANMSKLDDIFARQGFELARRLDQ